MMEESFSKALLWLDRAGSWTELKGWLDREKLTDALGAEGMTTLLDAWNRKESARLSDDELVEELTFWARGGTHADHLKGFQALGPAALLAEAERRDWFVRRLAGGAVVNPPDRGPISLTGAPGA